MFFKLVKFSIEVLLLLKQLNLFLLRYSVEATRRHKSMKFSTMLSMKKIQILKWGRRTAGNGSGVTLGSVQRRVPVRCCQGSHVAKQLVLRLKSQWRPALSLKWQRGNMSYSYDARSYSQNFDDGCSNDHRSPLAPK